MKGAYVDGFLLVVPKSKAAEYKKMAQQGKKIWLKYGALDYKECRGEDLTPQAMGGGPKPRSFRDAAKAKPDEEVWFSFIVFKSRKHRDQVNAKVMKDPSMSADAWKDKPMPFDMRRFSYGGFKVEIGT
ncbi:MAG TPA: DUF1428 domain-containing protein [Patescibacteria group bacterium]|nr:DUF1428 domain-containing protein [Patescibacteria group bacterium]